MADATLRMLLLGEDRGASKALDKVGNAADESGSKLGELGKKAKLAAGVMVAAIGGAAIGKVISDSMDFTAGQAKMTAQLGLTATQAGTAGKAAGSLFAQNYGDSMGEVQQAVGSVIQNIDGMRTASKSTLESVSAMALNTSKIFDQDLGGVTKAVSQMMRTGLAKNAKEAFDVITAGMQHGANKADDFLDTLNEYGTQFRKLGIDGKTATGLITQGLKGGARDADLVADAIKEFSIRAVDGSKTTAQGFGDIGLNAKKMSEQIAKGGPAARQGLDTVLDRLRAIKDPMKQSQAATKLFGTQAEDLGKALYRLDPSKAANGLGKVAGSAERANKALNDTPSARMKGFFRQLEGGAINIIGGKLIPALEHMGHGLTDGSDRAKFFSKVMDTAGRVTKDIGHWIRTDLLPFIQDLTHRFTDAMGGTKGFKQMLDNLKPAGKFAAAVLKVLWTGLKWAAEIIVPGIARQMRTAAIVVGALGKVAIWLWNNAFRPSMIFIGRALGGLMGTWAKMLRALGHVPGFGWATKAGNAMQVAANKAWNLGNSIKAIPPDKKVTITVTQRMRYSNNSGIGSAGGVPGYNTPHRAVGGPVRAGMPYWINERGQEAFIPSTNGRIATAQETMRGSRSGDIIINVNGAQRPDLTAREIRAKLLAMKRNFGGAPLGFE